MEGQSCQQNSGLPTYGLLNFIKFNGFIVIISSGSYLLHVYFFFLRIIFLSKKLCKYSHFSFSFLLFSSFIIWGLTGVIPERAMFRRTIFFFFFNSGDDCSGKRNVSFCLELFWDERSQDYSGFCYSTSGFHGCMLSRSVVSNSLLPYGPQPELLCPWDCPKQRMWRGVLCPQDLPNPRE